MEWNDLKVFLAVGRLKTLSAAAQFLGQTQPTMGRRLKVLESTLGQKLFHRTAEGFVLTEEGHGVLKHAEKMEADALSFEKAIADSRKSVEGSLRVSSIDWFGLYFLTPIFDKFLKEYPSMSLELLSDNTLVSLSHREADLAFRNIPFDEPDVIQKKVLQLPYALYGHKSLPKPAIGSGEGISIITLNSMYHDYPDANWLQTRFPKAHVSFRTNNRESQAQVCAEGRGYAVLPTVLADRFPSLQKLEYKDKPPSREIFMGYHKELLHMNRLQALRDFVVAEIGKK